MHLLFLITLLSGFAQLAIAGEDSPFQEKKIAGRLTGKETILNVSFKCKKFLYRKGYWMGLEFSGYYYRQEVCAEIEYRPIDVGRSVILGYQGKTFRRMEKIERIVKFTPPFGFLLYAGNALHTPSVVEEEFRLQQEACELHRAEVKVDPFSRDCDR